MTLRVAIIEDSADLLDELLAFLRHRGFDAWGETIEREVEGFHARVVQHECDHLDGRLYPTRMRDLTQFGYTDVLFPALDTLPDD